MFGPKRKPRSYGSIHYDSISELEQAEYRQNGMIRIKPLPPVLGYHHHGRTYTLYRSIDIQEILGGQELITWDPEVKLEIIAKVMITEYGIIGMEDKGDRYLLHVVEGFQRRYVLHDLEWNGCRARITDGGFITVFKEELSYD